MTFKDLKFENQKNQFLHGIQSRISFDNGYGASVVMNRYSYGGQEGLYEVAVLKDNEIDYDNPVANGDVIGNLTAEQVTKILIEIQKL